MNEAASPSLIDRADLFALFDHGRIDRPALDKGLRLMRNPAAWARFARILLLTLGLGLIASGIGFLVAANWKGMGDMDKLHLGMAGVTVAAALALLAGDTRLGRALLVTAAGLVGPLLALFGQAFQTGAELWLLFAGWAGLILPWAVIAVSPALWLLWLIVVEIALSIFFDSRPAIAGAIGDTAGTTLCAGLTLLALVLREQFVGTRFDRLAPGWSRPLLLASTLVLLTPAGLDLIFSNDWHEPSTIIGSTILVFLVGAGGWFYRHRRPDLPALALVGLAAAGFAACVWVRLIGQMSIFGGDWDFGHFILAALGIIGIFGAAAAWLRRTRIALRAEALP